MLSSQCMNYVAIQLSCSRRSPTKRMMQHAKGNISATSIVSLKASASLDWLTVPTFGALCDGNVIQQSVICVSFATDIYNEQGIQRHVIIVCNWGFSIVDTRYMATNQSGCWAIPSCLDFTSQLPVDIIVTTLISMPMMMVIKSCPYLQLSNLWRGCFTAASREDDNVDGVYKTSSLLRIGPWSLLQRNMAEWFCFCSFRRYTLNASGTITLITLSRHWNQSVSSSTLNNSYYSLCLQEGWTCHVNIPEEDGLDGSWPLGKRIWQNELLWMGLLESGHAAAISRSGNGNVYDGRQQLYCNQGYPLTLCYTPIPSFG